MAIPQSTHVGTSTSARHTALPQLSDEQCRSAPGNGLQEHRLESLRLALETADEPLTLQDLADRTNRSHAQVSDLLTHLERTDFIARIRGVHSVCFVKR